MENWKCFGVIVLIAMTLCVFVGCPGNTETPQAEYTISFDSDGGSEVSSIKVKSGERIDVQQIPVPTKDGFVFLGWYDGDAAFNWAKPVTSDVTLRAKWEKISVDIPENPDETTEPEDKPVEGDPSTDTPAGPDDKPTEGDKPTDTPGVPDDDPTKPGETNEEVYTVKYFYENINDSEYTENEGERKSAVGTIGVETTETADEVSGFETPVITQTTVVENAENVVVVKYARKMITLTFNLDGGTGTESISGKYGADVTRPAEPTKTGYTFASWNPNLPETFPVESAEYKATWTPRNDTKYTVEHWQENIENGEYALKESENLTGTTGTDTNVTAKTYAGFKTGTFENVGIAADGSTVVKVRYERKNITLAFDLDGGTGTESISGKYGADVAKPAEPTKTGYTFCGWSFNLRRV